MERKIPRLELLRDYAEGWHRTFREDKDGLLRSRRSIFFGTLGENFAVQFTSGVFSTTLLLILMDGADAVTEAKYFALISMISSVFGLLQLLSPVIFEPMRRRKGIILFLMGLSAGINLFLYPLLALVPMGMKTRMGLYIALLAVSTAATGVSGPAWSVLTVHSLPDWLRSDYFSIKRVIDTLVTAVLSFLLGVFMDWFKAHEMALAGILIFRGVALFCTLFYFRLFARAQEPDYNSGMERIRIRDILTAPFTSRKYLLICLIHVIYSAGAVFGDAFYNAYLLESAKVSYTFIGLSNVIRVPFTILFVPLWNRLVHKIGWLRTFALSLVFYSFAYIMNGVVTERSQWMYIAVAGYCSIIGGGWALGIANLPYMYLPEKMQNSCVTFFNMTAVLANTLSVWLGQRFLEATDGRYMHLFGLTLENRAYMNFVSWGAMLCALAAVLVVIRMERRQS